MLCETAKCVVLSLHRVELVSLMCSVKSVRIGLAVKFYVSEFVMYVEHTPRSVRAMCVECVHDLQTWDSTFEIMAEVLGSWSM
jgi:hypothetical protein